MLGRTTLIFTLGVLGGWILLGGAGKAIAQVITGLWASHQVEESYRISIGVDANGKPRRDGKVDELRTHYNLPIHYGNLIGITGHDGAAVFWYQDNTGVVRNAIVPDAATALSRIGYTDTKELELDPIQ
ncbi:MAG: hypothetical protein ACYTGJ_06170 [Planctomycetota bacterium]|jgi:hypothetical protein